MAVCYAPARLQQIVGKMIKSGPTTFLEIFVLKLNGQRRLLSNEDNTHGKIQVKAAIIHL